MSQLSKIPPSVSNEQLITQYGSTVLSELPQENVLKVLCAQLMKLAKMYQIKDFDFENAVILGQWIITNYKYEQLTTVDNCLRNPPNLEKTWRLTPEVIQSWMSFYLDVESSRREKEIHNEKFKEVQQEGDPDPRLEEWLKELDKAEAVRPITEEEIKYEGGEKPKKPKYVPPGVEYYILAQKKIEYGRECTDLHTGRIKPGMPSFEEWLNLSK